MSYRLNCDVKYPSVPGLDNSNFLGASSLDASRYSFLKSEENEVSGLTKTITVDSVFYSRSLNQNGGNEISRGCLYQITFNGLINDDDLYGSSLNGRDTLLIIDDYTSRCWKFTVVAVQRRMTNTYAVLLDDSCDSDFDSYVSETDKKYSVVYSRDLDVSQEDLFRLSNDISFSINYITNDSSNHVSSRVLSYSDVETPNPNIWVKASRTQFENGNFEPGNPVLLRNSNGSDDTRELIISGDCSFSNQTYDFTNSLQVNLLQLKLSDSVVVSLLNPSGEYEVGKRVYVSATPLDLESQDLGSKYFIGIVSSSSGNSFTLKTIYKPSGASRNSTSWYIVTEDPRINIPIENSDALHGLQNSDLVDYILENPSSSFRIQVKKNKKFSYYTARFKPVFSSSWRYVTVNERDTRIHSILTNCRYEVQIMGFGASKRDFSSFSDSTIFNTFS
jgi:hypothetical protein